MSFSKSLRYFFALICAFIAFGISSCKQSIGDDKGSFSSLNNSTGIANLFDTATIRDFTQEGSADVSFTAADLASDKFTPLSEEESYCVLTFRSKSPFRLKFTDGKMWNGILEYYPGLLTHDGWSLFTGATAPISVKSDKDGYYYLYLRGEGNTTITYDTVLSKTLGSTSHITFIQADSSYPLADIECYGTVESLLDWKQVKQGFHPAMAGGAFQDLFFECKNLIVAPAVTSPILNDACYINMFAFTSIKTPPALPATVLAPLCYYCMFRGCANLESLPVLPATQLKSQCYFGMFYDASKIQVSLNSRPSGYNEYSIARDIANGAKGCTDNMFGGAGNPITLSPSDTCYVSCPVVSGTTAIVRPVNTTSPVTDLSDQVGAQLLPYLNDGLNKYIRRPGNGGKIEFTLNEPYSVWYLFSDSSYTNHTIPSTDDLKKTVTISTSNANIKSNYNYIENSLVAGANEGYQTKSNYVEKFDIKDIGVEIPDDAGKYKHIIYTKDNLPKKDPSIVVPDLEQDNAFETKALETPLGDYVNKHRYFWSNAECHGGDYPSSTGWGQIAAVCRHVRKVKTASGVYKYLAIYSQESSPYQLSNELINEYADVFLKDGLDNDVYDKMTDLFGTERGVMDREYVQANAKRNASYAQYDFISTKDTITILFQDVPASGNYIACVTYSDYLDGELNDRCMMYVNDEYTLEYPAKIPSTLAHEFQHLLNYNTFYEDPTYADRYGIGLGGGKYWPMNEFLSILAESYISYNVFVNFKNPYTGKPLHDATSFVLGYRGEAFLRLYLSDKVNLFNLLDSSVSTYERDYLYPYFAYLGYYVLSNYGKRVIREYLLGANEGFDGLVNAINKVYPYANMTKTKLVADWQTTLMLSPIDDEPSITFPYYSRGGATGRSDAIWNLAKPRVSFGGYRDGMILPTMIYYCSIYNTSTGSLDTASLSVLSTTYRAFGDKNRNSGAVNTKSNAATRLVCQHVPAGSTFKAVAPELPENVMLTVVAVPHTIVQ